MAMKAYFSKITKVVVSFSLFFSVVGAGAGYIFPSIEGESRQNTLTVLRSRFAAVKERFESGDYRELMDVVERMGSLDELKKSTDKFAVDNFPESDWKTTMAELSGKKEFELFVSQKPGEASLIKDDEKEGAGEGAEESVMFPDIRLTGTTFAAGGKKVVTVFSINGVTEIWLWEKGEKGWITDSVTPGYGVKDAFISGTKVEFVLFSVSNLTATRTFSFDSGVNEALNQFASP